MSAKPALLAFLTGTLIAAGNASAVVIDFSRNGGNDFTNGTPTVTAPIDPLVPTRTITLVGTSNGAPAEIDYRPGSGSGFLFGALSSPTSTSPGITANLRVTLSFNFDGVLDGVDFNSLVNSDEARLTKNSLAATIFDKRFVQDSFFEEGSEPRNGIRIDSVTDSITGLGDIDEDFFTFQAGDTYMLRSDFSIFFFEGLTVLVPSPGAGAALLGVAGLLCMVRRRDLSNRA